jgi:DNA-binding beta-propeller fold protein YncE
MFFFEKKNQKTFATLGARWGDHPRLRSKVFCFFFSKKKCFLLVLLATHAAAQPLGPPAKTKYLTFDPRSQNLYIAHGTEVTVFNTQSATITGHIPGLNGAKSVAIAPNGHGYATSSKTATVTVFDTRSLKTLATLKAGDDTNAIIYDPATSRIFAMNDDADSITVIQNDKAIATINLPGGEGLESAAADGEGHIYVVHSARQDLLRIDARSNAVDGTIALPDCPKPQGLALNTADHRAYLSCAHSLAVIDTQTGHTVTTLPIGPASQTVIYDAVRHRIYTPNADGTLSVIAVAGPNTYRTLPAIPTPPAARTAAENPATGQIYLVSNASLFTISP